MNIIEFAEKIYLEQLDEDQIYEVIDETINNEFNASMFIEIYLLLKNGFNEHEGNVKIAEDYLETLFNQETLSDKILPEVDWCKYKEVYDDASKLEYIYDKTSIDGYVGLCWIKNGNTKLQKIGLKLVKKIATLPLGESDYMAGNFSAYSFPTDGTNQIIYLCRDCLIDYYRNIMDYNSLFEIYLLNLDDDGDIHELLNPLLSLIKKKRVTDLNLLYKFYMHDIMEMAEYEEFDEDPNKIVVRYFHKLFAHTNPTPKLIKKYDCIISAYCAYNNHDDLSEEEQIKYYFK